MNLLKVYGWSYRIPDSWQVFTIHGRTFRRKHAGAFVMTAMSGREILIHAEFV